MLYGKFLTSREVGERATDLVSEALPAAAAAASSLEISTPEGGGEEGAGHGFEGARHGIGFGGFTGCCRCSFQFGDINT